MMCDLDTRADLIRICWHGPASAFTKVILKNIGSGWARHLVPRISGPDKGLSACHYMDPVRLKKRLMLAYSIAFLQFLTAVFLQSDGVVFSRDFYLCYPFGSWSCNLRALSLFYAALSCYEFCLSLSQGFPNLCFLYLIKHGTRTHVDFQQPHPTLDQLRNNC